MLKVNDQVICTSKTIKSLTYDRVYTVRWVSGSRIVVNDDKGCGYYYSKEHFKKVKKEGGADMFQGELLRMRLNSKGFSLKSVSDGMEIINVRDDNSRCGFIGNLAYVFSFNHMGFKTLNRNDQKFLYDAVAAYHRGLLSNDEPTAPPLFPGLIFIDELKKREKDNVSNIKKLHRDIKNIYFNEKKRTTVIVFKNGDKVKATASKNTPFSEYAGFVTALFKYEHGLKLDDVEHLIKKKRG